MSLIKQFIFEDFLKKLTLYTKQYNFAEKIKQI